MTAKVNPTPSLSTRAVHADDPLNTPYTTDVSPAIHVSTTYRYPRNPNDLRPVRPEGWPTSDTDVPPHIYSRLTSPTTTRLETLLTQILKNSSLCYSSGLSAFFALITYFRPPVVAIGPGYHGCHSVLEVHKKLYGLKVVDLFNEKEWDAVGLGEGSIIHVETPVNPTGEARDLTYFAKLAKSRNAILSVDATFAPPPLLDPFQFGVDVVMHSGTKYIGGHSDMLCGVLAVRKQEWWEGLNKERVFLGSVMGNLEGWLGVRSLRTLELRVLRQSQSATKLALWLHGVLDGNDEPLPDDGPTTTEDKSHIRKILHKVLHTSTQLIRDPASSSWISQQYPNGYSPVFSILTHTTNQAKHLPSKLNFFHHATSLGGVESLIEWRRMTHLGADERLLRISVGVETWEDLRDDLVQAMRSLSLEGVE
ncbi:hypothetical protein HK097_008854 [Rhizophlyctis rosea]|uniref:Cystathionine gamma-synthase n=1 Tax=Rhizophlyctis rosea TaxID=64517 RepID=A0AAD5X1F9_9FUNG|nr:hypothetical protein HK097_008854 [Rhizophlyctis rosea]